MRISWAVVVLSVGLALAGCGNTASVDSTPPPAVTGSYGDCVSEIVMNPDDVQGYIDEVEATCGVAPE
jgi:hypothetical protein